MGGLWQSLKHKISRSRPDRKSKSFEAKSEPVPPMEQTKSAQDYASLPEKVSTPAADSNGLRVVDQSEVRANGGRNLTSEEPSMEIGSENYVSKEPLSSEQKALIDSLRVEYEDVEDESPREEVMVVEYTGYESRVEIQPRIYESQTQMHKKKPSSGLIAGHQVEATPYSISFPIPSAISAPPPDLNTIGVSNLEAGSDSAKRSYLSIIPTTVQCVTENLTLFVWHANFHPAIGRRFSSVRVNCKFSSTSRATPASSMSGVEIKAFAPHKSFGASSKEQRKITWGLELPLTVPAGPVQVGVTPSGSRETSKEVEHAFTIEGSARGTPLRNSCVWTVQENASTERGIPSELQLAAMVKHSGPLQFDVDIEGYTAGGYLPSHHLRPKTDAMGRRKVIDPTKYAGLLQEFDFGGKGQIGCAKLLEQWTGQVQGAILEFDQPIMRA